MASIDDALSQAKRELGTRTPEGVRAPLPQQGDGLDGWRAKLNGTPEVPKPHKPSYAHSMRADATEREILKGQPTLATNASGGKLGVKNPGYYAPPVPSAPAPEGARNEPGYFDATRANWDASSEGMRKAQGFGQTAGATIAGAAKIAGGVVLDAGRALVMDPLKAAAGIGKDMYDGAVNPGAQSPTMREPAPEAPAAAPVGSDESDAETARLTRQNAAFRPGMSVAGAGDIRRINTPGKSPLYSNDFSPAGQEFANAKNPVQTAPAFDMKAAERVAALQREVNGLRVAENDRGALNFGGGNSAAAAKISSFGEDLRAKSGEGDLVSATTAQNRLGMRKIEQDRANAFEQNAVTARGQDIQRENNQATVGASIYSTDATMRNNTLTRQRELAKAELEQTNKNREFGMREREVKNAEGQNAIKNREGAENQLQKNLEARYTTGSDSDGKPIVDRAAMQAQRFAIDRAVAKLGFDGIHKVSPEGQEELMAASELLTRIQKDGGMMPWEPALLKTVDALDLVGMRVTDEGMQITNKDSKAFGQVIPKRYFETKEANYLFPGTPGTPYNVLLEKGTK